METPTPNERILAFIQAEIALSENSDVHYYRIYDNNDSDNREIYKTKLAGDIVHLFDPMLAENAGMYGDYSARFFDADESQKETALSLEDEIVKSLQYQIGCEKEFTD